MKETELKLHLGCGNNHLKGYFNVDLDSEHNPDVVLNLDNDWTMFHNNSVDEIKCHFVLEHIDWRHFFKEAYRVLKPGGILDVAVPNQHDFVSWQDPTHVRGWFVNSWMHIANYEHKHYNTNSNPWNFSMVKVNNMYRSLLSRILYYVFKSSSLTGKLGNIENIAYLFVHSVQWIMRCEK